MLWTETLPFSLFCDKVIEVTSEVKRRNLCFLQSGFQNGSIWVFEPPPRWARSFRQRKTNWLCEPENNLRTRYIQNPAGTEPPFFRTRGRVSACRLGKKTSPRHLSVPKYLYQKGQHSSEKTKELLWRLE